MQVVLVMFRPDGQRRSFSIARDVTLIGRREDCDFRIPLSDVSRKHCRLIRDADSGTLRVEDLGSSNGTFVNGTRVEDAHLNAGDTVAVGPVTFVVQIDGAPLEDEMQPVLPAAGAAAPASADSAAPAPAAAADESDALTPEQLGSADDDEIARILNAEDNAGSSVGGQFPLDNSDSLGDAILDADTEDQKPK